MKFHCQGLSSDEDKEAFQWCVRNNQGRILLIIDGLDELFEWDKVANYDDRLKINSIHDEASIPEIVYSIISKDLLPQCRTIVTSRPIENVSGDMFDEVVVALGFDEESIDECSFSVCEFDREIHRQITEFLQKNPKVLTFCVVPLNCVLFSAILNSDMRKNNCKAEQIEINSLSQLGVRVLLDIVHKGKEQFQGFNFSEDQKDLLIKLCHLASASLLGESLQLVFDEDDLKSSGLDRECWQQRTVTGLLEIYAEEDISLVCDERGISASFIHFSVQELLAAVHVCLNWTEVHVRKVATVDPFSRRLDFVQLYTVGLLGDDNLGHKLLQALSGRSLGHPSQIYTEQVQEFVRSITEVSGERRLSQLTKLQLIRCAHEGRLPQLIRDVANAVLEENGGLKELDFDDIDGGLLPHHLSSIGYFVDCCSQVDKLNLDNCTISMLGLRTLFLEHKRGGWSHVKNISLIANPLEYESFRPQKITCGALTGLKDLGILRNKLSAEGLDCLVPILKSAPNLDELRLGNNRLGNEGGSILADALRYIPMLRVLGLTDNGIGDSGSIAISKACQKLVRLERIGLSNNKISEEGAKVIPGFLKQCPKLELLSLYNNQIQEKGATAVAELLRTHPNGSLKVWFQCNNISSETNSSLRLEFDSRITL